MKKKTSEDKYIHPSHKTMSDEERASIIKYMVWSSSLYGLTHTYEDVEEMLDKVLSEPLIDLLGEDDVSDDIV